jgi:hypothetical protein
MVVSILCLFMDYGCLWIIFLKQNCMFQLCTMFLNLDCNMYVSVLYYGAFGPVHLGCAKLGRPIYKPDGHPKPGRCGCGCGCQLSPMGCRCNF